MTITLTDADIGFILIACIIWRWLTYYIKATLTARETSRRPTSHAPLPGPGRDVPIPNEPRWL